MKRWIFASLAVTVVAGCLLAGGRAWADKDDKTVMRIGPLQISAGVDEAGFVKALNQFETKKKLQPSSEKEAHLLFATFDANRDGRITAEENRAGLAARDQAKGKKRSCNPDPPTGPSGGCEYNTCDCDAIDMGSELPGGGAPSTEAPTGSGSAGNGQWCGGNCHCHCNTFLCSANGT